MPLPMQASVQSNCVFFFTVFIHMQLSKTVGMI